MDYRPQIEAYLERLRLTLDHLNRDDINQVLTLLVDAYQHQRQIFIMGNGGSAATASHFVCDFNKGLSYGKSKRFKMICLNDNLPTLMALANDVGYEHIFVEQLKCFLQPEDLVIGISGSGNSPNVLQAIAYANENGATTVGLSGYDGGKLKTLAHYGIQVAIADMQITEDIHMVLDHLMMRVLCDSGL